ncbi:MAG: hypothetical protein WB799_05835 [Candidatus Sulfotelmatobacter sp.]
MTTTSTPTLTPRVQEIVTRVLALREYTRTSGHKTTKSQHQLIQALDGIELADALIAIKQGGGTFE